MNGLNDYSGKFKPNIKLEDFSKDIILKLTKLYSRFAVTVDGFWYLSVMEKVGNDEAMAFDLWVWERQTKYELDKITKLLNIQGNDVVALLKAFQFSSWVLNLEYQIDVRNNDLGVLTITHCPTLVALEREGKARDKDFCKAVEPPMFKMYANYFNKDIEVNYLKLPPRRSKDEICCQWEFALREDSVKRIPREAFAIKRLRKR